MYSYRKLQKLEMIEKYLILRAYFPRLLLVQCRQIENFNFYMTEKRK